MPECLVLGERAQEWQLQLENLGARWRCVRAVDAQDAYAYLNERAFALAVMCKGEDGKRLLEMLRDRPPLSPPWLLTEENCPWADGEAALDQCGTLPLWLECREKQGCVPRAALMRHQQLACLARGMMRTLNVPSRLKAWEFLPDMLALCAVHPSLAEDLNGRLYPLLGRRHGLTPAAVERRLRLAIESTWSGASLAALERFFGHSVDPERGKPTNREFLLRVQERLLLAGRRIA